jgi:hypothetical protein
VTDFAGYHDEIRALAIDGRGRIVAGGMACEFPGNSDEVCDFGLARYTRAGVLDNRFGHRGKVRTDLGGDVNEGVRGVVIQGDGRIVAARVSVLTTGSYQCCSRLGDSSGPITSVVPLLHAIHNAIPALEDRKVSEKVRRALISVVNALSFNLGVVGFDAGKASEAIGEGSATASLHQLDAAYVCPYADMRAIGDALAGRRATG